MSMSQVTQLLKNTLDFRKDCWLKSAYICDNLRMDGRKRVALGKRFCPCFNRRNKVWILLKSVKIRFDLGRSPEILAADMKEETKKSNKHIKYS